MLALMPARRNPRNLIPLAKSNKRNHKNNHSSKKPWWQKIFSEEDDDDSENEILSENLTEREDLNSEQEKFEAWRRKAEAIVELREAQEEARNEEGRAWEDWIQSDGHDQISWDQDWGAGGGDEPVKEEINDDPTEIIREKGVFGAIRASIEGRDQDLLFEDRVFKYASTNSAKFIVLLVLVPWMVDFVVHDFVLMPFLDRYVKKVPLAAELLDVRRSQKLEMVKALKVERARFQLEVEIGRAPPLSDEEIWWELRQKAIEMREEWRLENRRAFANIWSDMVYGIVLFILIYFNATKVALLKFTGYKLLNNISDTGKAFLIILVTDIFLGYHSESGWQTLIEIILERYGLEVDQAVVTIFICVVPVVLDAFVKLWLFKYLPRLSPNVTNIFREMKRH